MKWKSKNGRRFMNERYYSYNKKPFVLQDTEGNIILITGYDPNERLNHKNRT